MIRQRLLSIAILFAVIAFGHLFAQDDMLESSPVHKNERALSFSLATNGFGIGGTYRWKLPSYLHAGVNLEFFIIRDDDEIDVIDPFTLRPIKLNDTNRLFLIPATVELKKRLFANDIEDDFRPHVMVSTGGIFGMNFPKEQFITDPITGSRERVQPDNEFKFAWNALVGFGVDFTTNKNTFATLRMQYRVARFATEIAGTDNHDAFEIKFEIGGQF